MPDLARQLRAIAAGDPAALSSFYESRFDSLLAIARCRGALPEAAALDVVQDVVLRLVHARRTPSTDEECERWLASVARNAARDRLKSEIRRRARESAHAEVAGVVSRSGDAAAGRRSGVDDRVALLRALDELGGAERELLHRRFRLGWTLDRIGRELDVGPGVVDGRLRRTLARLRRVLNSGARAEPADADRG